MYRTSRKKKIDSSRICSSVYLRRKDQALKTKMILPGGSGSGSWISHVGSSTHSHTYISEAHNSESTIDHILCHSRFLDAFTSAKVLDECPLNTSDHLPISATIQITLAAAPSLMTTSSSTPRVNWSKLSSSEIEERYTSPLETAVNSWSFPLAPGCSSHIDSSISNLIHLMNNTALKGLPLKKYKKHIIPGWSMYLKSAHSESKSAFRHWKSAGKPMAPANPLKEIAVQL